MLQKSLSAASTVPAPRLPQGLRVPVRCRRRLLQHSPSASPPGVHDSVAAAGVPLWRQRRGWMPGAGCRGLEPQRGGRRPGPRGAGMEARRRPCPGHGPTFAVPRRSLLHNAGSGPRDRREPGTQGPLPPWPRKRGLLQRPPRPGGQPPDSQAGASVLRCGGSSLPPSPRWGRSRHASCPAGPPPKPPQPAVHLGYLAPGSNAQGPDRPASNEAAG